MKVRLNIAFKDHKAGDIIELRDDDVPGFVRAGFGVISEDKVKAEPKVEKVKQPAKPRVKK